jgi:hypothetical protein
MIDFNLLLEGSPAWLGDYQADNYKNEGNEVNDEHGHVVP